MPIILLGALAAFVICLIIGPFAIKILHQLKFGQSVRTEGPQTHLKKAGTPTMGGIIILISMVGGLVAGVVAGGELSREIIWLLFLTISFGLIGFIDDLLIIVRKKSLGLKARQKLFAQFICAGLVIFLMIQNNFSTSQLVPFTNLNLSFQTSLLGNVLFVIYGLICIVGFSNGINFADGLDGLAGGTTAIALLIMGALTYMQQQYDLTLFAFVLAAACIGFVWFNGPPAKIFMGDTGALALGAAFAGIGLFSRLSLFLLIVGGIFIAELLSVIIQVASFKTYGKRVFKMSPIHHHFELEGMQEPQIMVRFWIVGAVLGVLAIIGYMLR